MSLSKFPGLAQSRSIAAICAPLVLTLGLTGCPDDTATRSPVTSIPGYATAPAVKQQAAPQPAATPTRFVRKVTTTLTSPVAIMKLGELIHLGCSLR